jgi:hypothetical protein
MALPASPPSEVTAMDGVITIVIVFFVLNMVFRFFKKMAQPAKKNQEQTQAEAAKPKPKPAVRREDFRFPSPKKAVPAPVFQEGRDPDAVMSTYTPITPSTGLGGYTPITPSTDLKNQFSDYKGSLDVAPTEGIGYHAEAYDAVPAPYVTGANSAAKVLPETFNRDALLRAVVMSEILKRPGVRR